MPDPDEKDLWRIYAAKISPIGKSKTRTAFLKTTQREKGPPLSPALSRSRAESPLRMEPSSFNQEFSIALDRRMERRLREGSVRVEARLDLHGMTQNEAYAALHTFMAAQVKAHHRMVLIITGKGRSGEGVLRTYLHTWLQSLPVAADILALRPAALRHGGAGAFYVILRRKKEKL